MGRPRHAEQAARGDMHTLLLRRAQEVLQTESFPGFTLQAVAERAGIKKASLYRYFPSREALAQAVLCRSTLTFRRWAQEQTDSPEQRLRAFIGLFQNLIVSGQVCPVSAFAASWDAAVPALQQATLELRRQQLHWLTGLFEEAGQPPHLARRSAVQLVALIQGALLAARVEGDRQVFDEVTQDAVRLLIARDEPASSRTGETLS